MVTKGDDEVDDETDNKTDDDDNENREEIDTADMPDLQSQESTAQKREHEGKGYKILTPKQVLSRLPISLAQLKVGNNSEKLQNEIIQLLYSLYRSKKLSKTIYNNLMNTMEKIFMNTLYSKTDESNKFMYQFTDKLNLKNPNKSMALANSVFIIHGKTLNLNTTTINLKFLLQLGIMNLICLMDHVLFLIYKIVLIHHQKTQNYCREFPCTNFCEKK